MSKASFIFYIIILYLFDFIILGRLSLLALLFDLMLENLSKGHK